MSHQDAARNDDENDVDPDGSNPYFSKSDPSPLLLRLAADMFRQHADLFLQQAATLERISASPADPDAWNLTEASPESIQASIHQDLVTTVAMKSFESMCQVQKRVDYLERLMMRNGIGAKRIPKEPRPPLPTLHAKQMKEATTPLFWLTQEHGERLDEEVGTENVNHELVKLWNSMNPAQRKPYIVKAASMKKKPTASGKSTRAKRK